MMCGYKLDFDRSHIGVETLFTAALGLQAPWSLRGASLSTASYEAKVRERRHGLLI